MFFAALSLVALEWKQPRCPLTGEYISGLLPLGHKADAVSPGFMSTFQAGRYGKQRASS